MYTHAYTHAQIWSLPKSGYINRRVFILQSARGDIQEAKSNSFIFLYWESFTELIPNTEEKSGSSKIPKHKNSLFRFVLR